MSVQWPRLLGALAALALAPAIVQAATFEDGPRHWMTITACNDFRTLVYVAFAFHEDGDWTSRGWVAVPPGTCRKARLPTADVAFHAESQWYQNGDHTSRNMWGGSQRFCVTKGRFTYHPARGRCAGGELSNFSMTFSYQGDIRYTLRSDGRRSEVKFL
jgi:uncharacterized membrane protein